MPQAETIAIVVSTLLVALVLVVVALVRRRRSPHDTPAQKLEATASHPLPPPAPELLMPKVPEAARPLMMSSRASCNCFDNRGTKITRHELKLHPEVQDTGCDAWKELNEAIEKASRDQAKKFEPVSILGVEKYQQIIELPPSIGKLKAVEVLSLYGSNLVRIPPEIGEMTSLAEFDPYTSYRLHWLPYEILHCKNLKRSRVSTRALYGNYKHRQPFPRLPQDPHWMGGRPERCSVCDRPFATSGPIQAWISLKVATDTLPLLVHACSQKCLDELPAAPERYLQRYHQGGKELRQPSRE
jgi:hypothetical protein